MNRSGVTTLSLRCQRTRLRTPAPGFQVDDGLVKQEEFARFNPFGSLISWRVEYARYRARPTQPAPHSRPIGTNIRAKCFARVGIGSGTQQLSRYQSCAGRTRNYISAVDEGCLSAFGDPPEPCDRICLPSDAITLRSSEEGTKTAIEIPDLLLACRPPVQDQ